MGNNLTFSVKIPFPIQTFLLFPGYHTQLLSPAIYQHFISKHMAGGAEKNSSWNIYFALESKLFYFNWRNQAQHAEKKKKRQKEDQDSVSEKLK